MNLSLSITLILTWLNVRLPNSSNFCNPNTKTSMIRRNTTNMHTEGMGRVNPNILSPSSSSSRRNNGINQRLDQQPSQNTTGSKVPISTYKYNTTTAILLLPPLLLIYHQAATATLGAILYVILSLYLFDLSGMSHTSREFLLLFLWIGFFFVSVSLWVDRLGGGVGHGNVYVAVGMGDLIMETMLIFCLVRTSSLLFMYRCMLLYIVARAWWFSFYGGFVICPIYFLVDYATVVSFLSSYEVIYITLRSWLSF